MNSIGEGSSASIRLDPLDGAGGETIIDIEDCIDFCSYRGLKITVEKISDINVYYSVSR